MGAHPKGPSGLVRGGRETDLLEVLAADPVTELGPELAREHGPRLPFLLKLLAAEQPLSLQAHPDEARARSGYADEEERGVPAGAPERRYCDPHHKPELLCALTEFEALCGFRDVPATVGLLDRLDCPPLVPLLDVLRREEPGEALRAVFTTVTAMPPAELGPLVDAVVDACARLAGEHPSYDWASRPGDLHPGDAGVVVSLLLNHLRLAPDEAVYLPAGNLHAYLRGTGIEVMASSDNVLRGGLTSKHVDAEELAAVLCFEGGPVGPVPVDEVGPGMCLYRTPAREFALLRVVLDGAVSEAVLPPAGPQVLFCTAGEVRASQGDGPGSEVELRSGESAYAPAGRPPVRLSGRGTVFRAAPQGPPPGGR